MTPIAAACSPGAARRLQHVCYNRAQ